MWTRRKNSTAVCCKSIKFGVKHTDHDRDLRFNATTYGGFHVPINTLPASTFAGSPTPGDFLDNVSSAGTLKDYWQVDEGAVERVLFANLAQSGRVLYPQQSFSAKEKTYGGYVMGNLAGDRWRANVGVRLVRTKQTTARCGLRRRPGLGQQPLRAFHPDHRGPQLHRHAAFPQFAYDLRPDVVLRFAAAKVMARPDYTDIVPRATLNSGALTGSAGNPDLDPYRANQEDLSLEWYPDGNTAFSLALYTRTSSRSSVDVPVNEFFPIESATIPNRGVFTPARHRPFQLSLHHQPAFQRRRWRESRVWSSAS